MIKEKVFAKVILTGEHSVLRGGTAVVAPVENFSFDYTQENAQKFELLFDEKAAPYDLIIRGTLERALKMLGKTKADFTYKIHINSVVPLGMGLGGSAALCVFTAKLMSYAGYLSLDKIFGFAVELENMFHGESSGVDIAGCLGCYPQSYIRGEEPQIIHNQLTDFVFGLTPSGETGNTEECIEKVLLLKAKDKNLFYDLDESMNQASLKLVEAMVQNESGLFIEGIGQACEVFYKWGLVPQPMKKLLNELSSRGALAVKPTGSGMGGYIFSVWKKEDIKKAQDFNSITFVL